MLKIWINVTLLTIYYIPLYLSFWKWLVTINCEVCHFMQYLRDLLNCGGHNSLYALEFFVIPSTRHWHPDSVEVNRETQGFYKRLLDLKHCHYFERRWSELCKPRIKMWFKIYTWKKIMSWFGVVSVYFDIYRVSQEECARFRESVPYVKVYRYNPKHLYPKLNSYGDNGQRSLKLWQLLHTYWLPNKY